MYEEYKDLAKRIRKNCLHMCYVGQGGHMVLKFPDLPIQSFLPIPDLLCL